MSGANRTPTRPEARRGGFSLVELLMAVSIVGILSAIAIPNMRNMTFRARATNVAADLEILRLATLDYNADALRWPADAAAGVIPPELVDYLPEGFSFDGNGYELDFEVLSFSGGLPGDPTTTQLIAAIVTSADDRLHNAIAELLGGNVVASAGNTHTVVIERS
ncbi:MAG TPA: type II secretion system protein [Longimicrobiales bacterium]|nr:type II secretion system protein [Longimicrobiales bacterium]